VGKKIWRMLDIAMRMDSYGQLDQDALHKLVGGLEHFFHTLGMIILIIPTDELIFFTGFQTTNQ
jgi:hypothetical protein